MQGDKQKVKKEKYLRFQHAGKSQTLGFWLERLEIDEQVLSIAV